MKNPLYPAFFRLDRLHLLVVGAGEVGEEKLSFILKSSPNARVTIVAPWMGEDLKSLLDEYRAAALLQGVGSGDASDSYRGQDAKPAPREQWWTAEGGRIVWFDRKFCDTDVERADLVVAATNFEEVNHQVWRAAKSARRLTNVADTPSLCDFYLGSIVTRGPLKVAISTNGQSPTFAKRFRQWLEAELPEAETSQLIANLKAFRDRLTGDFATKVRELNAVTSSLLDLSKTAPPANTAPASAPKETATPEENKFT
jgi:precorrin-2 dehydrogenase/sirohydrochlorin ferrochelatase